MVELSCGYGVRAWVDGTWSFQHGNVLTPEAVAAAATGAVAGARYNAATNQRLARRRLSTSAAGVTGPTDAWAPAPAVTGEWTIPVEVDPFTVPIDDYHRVLGALAYPLKPRNVYASASARGQGLAWRGETRVFASSEGSLVTQHTLRGGVVTSAFSRLPGENPPTEIRLEERMLGHVWGGFESALRPEPLEALRPQYESVVRWHDLPFKRFDDVGRFPVVLDGRTTAALIGCTLDTALDGDRVSGLEADASGGSFLEPPDSVLGAATAPFSPLLTMRVDRALPSPSAVQWDDDGVVPEPYTVVEQGKVVDYHTTRETAPMLADWYATHGRTLRSHGTAVAPKPSDVPCGTGGHVQMSPGTTHADLDTLVRELDHGFLVIHGVAQATPGLTGAMVQQDPYDGVVFEVRRGVPVARVAPQLQCKTTLAFGKNLLAIGDARTLATTDVSVQKGIPWTESTQWVTAPAVLCKDFEITQFL